MKVRTQLHLARAASAEAPSVLVQHFTATFEYPVVFTEGVFTPENPALADVLGRLEPARLHRLFAVIDDGVASAWPGLAGDITA